MPTTAVSGGNRVGPCREAVRGAGGATKDLTSKRFRYVYDYILKRCTCVLRQKRQPPCRPRDRQSARPTSLSRSRRVYRAVYSTVPSTRPPRTIRSRLSGGGGVGGDVGGGEGDRGEAFESARGKLFTSGAPSYAHAIIIITLSRPCRPTDYPVSGSRYGRQGP